MSLHKATETPTLPGWYLCQAVDDRWNGEFRYRAWGNGFWWIPLRNSWLSSRDDIYNWDGPFADVHGPAPDGTNPGGPVPDAAGTEASTTDSDTNPENSNITIGVPELLYQAKAYDTKETEMEAMDVVHGYFLHGRPDPEEVENFIVQFMQRSFRFQTCVAVIGCVANLNAKIPSYDKFIEYCYTQADAENIARDDILFMADFRTKDFAANAARPAFMRLESYMCDSAPTKEV